jgi:SAM-dependent methyltransferase
MMEDAFEGIAADYDRMFPRDICADRALLRSLFEKRGVERVLDCACGTGIHLPLLLEDGFHVTGSDLSPAMLRVARSRLEKAGVEVELHESSWRDLPDKVPGRYDAVICLGNSLPLEIGEEAVRRSLEGMRAMLREGGILVLAIRNADLQLKEKPRLVAIEPEPDLFLLNICEYGPESVTQRFFLIDSRKVPPSMSYYVFELYDLTASRLKEIALKAGVERFTLYGDESLTEFSPYESQRLIFVGEQTP